MTKLRAPLTSHDALARVAGQLPGGWQEAAAIAERKLNTVYNWGNPDTPEEVPFGIAVKLDVAFQQAGGIGRPFYETFGHQLQIGLIDAMGDTLELSRQTETAMREAGEAFASIMAICRPDASDEELARALRETPEAVSALDAAVPIIQAMLKARRRSARASEAPDTS